jgi:sugar/nucleoside kinase (ribokinase family)
VIVIVGSLAWRVDAPVGPAGRASAIALAAVTAGATVEVVGRLGDDAAGDALLLAFSRAGVGHAAVLRDPTRPTPVLVPDEHAGEPESPLDEAPADPGVDGRRADPRDGPRLEAADVDLAVRYLHPSGVLVITDDVPLDALAAAVAVGGFAGMRLVVLLAPSPRRGGVVPAGLPADATVLAAPDDGAEPGAFEALVGAYAAALDRGIAPEAAFAAAAGTGWEALAGSD